jgi:pSer/pThr/pTyr-binding forkhead associated (FHA) protein
MPIELSWRLSGSAAASGGDRTILNGSGPFSIGRSTQDNAVILSDDKVSRWHAEIRVDGARVTVADKQSQNGTFIAGRRITTSAPWHEGEELRIGSFVLTYRQRAADHAPRRASDETVLDQGQLRQGEPRRAAEPRAADRGDRQPAAEAQRFPGRIFENRIVAMRDLRQTGKVEEEVTYLAVGGGIGSFCWVDHLRVFGVPAAHIRVIGVSPDRKPYQKWGRLCRASQIPDHERIRSNSISVPDNIWGFPGYASREFVRDILQGRLSGLKYLIQVFGEPAITESYTPRISDVYRSFDTEARRIGWDDMWRLGQVVGIRKTDDDRYAIAYRRLRDGQPLANETPEQRADRERFIIARFVHIATGYPASNYLPDLQKFKLEHPESKAVVNAYEEHDDIYRSLEQKGGTILIRGRGIVASRVIQRVWEARAKNKEIRLLHLVRNPIAQGAKYDLSRRALRNDVEQQPFNWPKACWGGTLRRRLEAASPEERVELLKQWDGTTTADRDDWNRIIEEGTREGWYKIFYGNVAAMAEKNGRVVTRLESKERQEAVDLTADFIVDCTGLVAKLDETPLIADLIRTYDLTRNRAGSTGSEQSLAGLAVSNSFEIPGLQNGQGRAYAAGVVASRGPYAAVDSFLGLQYAALRSADHLGALRAPGVSRFGPIRSAYQWTKWCVGSPP